MLRFYWQLGKELHDRKDRFSYGQSFYKTISRDLRRELPDVKSFSETNLKYMQYFWEMYPDAANRPQVADDFDETIVFCIPWGHQRVILDKCKGNPQKALFFVNQVVQNNWSRAVLLNFLDTDLYERQGKAITNFALTLRLYRAIWRRRSQKTHISLISLHWPKAIMKRNWRMH